MMHHAHEVSGEKEVEMKKLWSWLAGFAIGGGIGAIIIMLFFPLTSKEVRDRLKAGYEETMEEARKASEKRRAELEAELLAMRGTPLPQSYKTPSLKR
jgi:uncharacterized membrane protein YgaE (UPF0421/DUF939 family)